METLADNQQGGDDYDDYIEMRARRLPPLSVLWGSASFGLADSAFLTSLPSAKRTVVAGDQTPVYRHSRRRAIGSCRILRVVGSIAELSDDVKQVQQDEDRDRDAQQPQE